MSGPTSAAERLADLDRLPAASPGAPTAASLLGDALRAGERRRRRRTRAAAAGLAAALVAAALVRHATTPDAAPTAAPPGAATESLRSGPLARDVQRDQDVVEQALAAVAPDLPALDWTAARTSTERAAPSGPGTGEQVLVDLTRSAAFTGGDPGDPGGGARSGVAYRITTPLLRFFPTDPCRVRGALDVPAAPSGSGGPGCTLHTGLPGGPGGSAVVPGAGGVVALREWQRVVGTSLRAGSAVGSVVQTVRQAVLVSNGTTWSLAATAVGDAGAGAGSGAEPALRLDQLELGVRYLAAAAIEDGPGVATARLVSEVVLARELPAVAPGAPAVDWASPGADSSGAAPPGPDGRRLLDLLETTDLGGRARLGYRVVRAAGPAPQDPCDAAGVVARQRTSTCRSEARDDGTRVAVLDRPGTRQVTLVVTPAGTGTPTATGGVGRWVAVAVTARGPGTAPALPLDAGQLERLTRALAGSAGR